MSSTIETIHNNILVKINCIEKIIEIVKSIDIKVYDIEQKINSISYEYQLGSVEILTNYFLLIQNEKHGDYLDLCNKYYTDYQSFITQHDFVGKLDRISNSIRNIIESLPHDVNINNLKSLFAQYSNSNIIRQINNIIYNLCINCKKEMQLVSSTSELICNKCGLCQDLYGTVFEDDQFYYQEGHRSKHGSYDPSKHCRYWIDRIQARESKEIPQKVIDAIRKCISDNNIKNIDSLSCKDIRKFLSSTKNSIYNEHIPLIRKIITGQSPPQITEKEVQLITIYFDKVIKVYEEIKPADKTNVPYHPYIIYKIIEQILPRKTFEDRTRIYNILNSIHLQSRETLIENDKTWKQICDRIIELNYIPTDRNSQNDD